MQKMFPFAALALTNFLGACGGTTMNSDEPMPPPLLSTLNTSRGQWTSVSNAAQHNYQYFRSNSTYSGARQVTTVQVTGNRVTSRAFLSTQRGGHGNDLIIDQWTETSADLNTHRNGHPAITLDEVYQECSNMLLRVSGEQQRIVVSVDAKGLLSRCFYEVMPCSDGDCLKGIFIDEIRMRPLNK